MAWACMAANGTVSLVFTDDVTADRSSGVNSDVFWTILSTLNQPNAAKLIGWCIIMPMNNDPKRTAKAD